MLSFWRITCLLFYLQCFAGNEQVGIHEMRQEEGVMDGLTSGNGVTVNIDDEDYSFDGSS